jgi:hypothetical protein
MTHRFFIVGSGRCGTKMLWRLLVGHPDVEVCTETHFLPTLHDRFGREPITVEEYIEVIEDHYDSKGDRWVENLHAIEGRDYSTFHRDFRAACEGLERATAAEFTERFHKYLFGREVPFVGDKTPHYGAVMDLLVEYWPDARFVHLVRDGVYAAESMTHHPGFRKIIGAGIDPEDVARAAYGGTVAELPDRSVSVAAGAEFWEDSVRTIREQGARLSEEQYMELRYEDVLADPDAALREVSRFLGLPAAPAWHADATIVPYPFFLRRIDTRMDEAEYRSVYDDVRDTMEAYGYPVDNHRYDLGKELLRSVRYYRRNWTDLDYWKRLVYRRLH